MHGSLFALSNLFFVQIWVLNHSQRNNKIFQFCFCWNCHLSNNLCITTWVNDFQYFYSCDLPVNVSFSTLPYLLSKYFSWLNFYFWFTVDKQHPCWLEILTMAELRISSFPPLSLNVLVYTSCECGCIHEDSLFSLSRLVNSTFRRMDGALAGSWWMWCLAEFPRLKGRKNIYLYSSFWLEAWVGVDYESLPSSIIPEL